MNLVRNILMHNISLLGGQYLGMELVLIFASAYYARFFVGYFLGLIILILCLTGCGEFGVIGAAAMRELRADAIAVNWRCDEGRKVEKRNEPSVTKKPSSNKGKDFSSFRHDQSGLKKPLKGLWEQRSVDER